MGLKVGSKYKRYKGVVRSVYKQERSAEATIRRL